MYNKIQTELYIFLHNHDFNQFFIIMIILNALK